MKLKVNLQGEWKFLLSKEKPADSAVCSDTITLPSTVQQMKKSPLTAVSGDFFEVLLDKKTNIMYN